MPGGHPKFDCPELLKKRSLLSKVWLRYQTNPGGFYYACKMQLPIR